MNNIVPSSAKVDAQELPSGFTTEDPNSRGPKQANQTEERELQKQAILEQALTSEALARLRRIKVGQ